MRLQISKASLESGLLKEVQDLSGENVWACYQCGNCSAGCPLSFAMDLLPNQVIRLLHLGQAEDVFGTETVWLCASCLTCMTRCPRGVDLSRIMEAVRYVALRRGKAPDRYGPDRVEPDEARDAPPQALASVFRKMGA
jgi:heterodisulfide reductase subunit C